jgi:Leucine-rich repeat (LRR) protein
MDRKLPNLSRQKLVQPPLQVRHSRQIVLPVAEKVTAYIRQWGSPLEAEWKLLSSTADEVEVPPNMEVRLKIPSEVAQLDWLNTLAPYDVQALELIGLHRAAEQVAPLGRFEYLRSLYLNSERVGGANLTFLEKLTQLEQLFLPNTQVKDADLAFLQTFDQLELLDLSFTLVTGDFLGYLATPSVLKTLDVAYTKLRANELGLLNRCSNLEYINMYDNGLDDEVLPHLLGLTHLRSLNLGQNEITDAIIPVLLQSLELEELNLMETRITDETLRAIAALSMLKELDVTSTAVSNRGIAHLKDHRFIQIIQAQQTHVNSAAERYTLKMRDLVEFNYDKFDD